MSNNVQSSYSDFYNLAKKIKGYINQNINLNSSFRQMSKTSKAFKVKDSFRKVTFELNFLKYDSKNDEAELVLQFIENKYRIRYSKSTYYVFISNSQINLDVKSLKKILDIEFFNYTKTNTEIVFPDYFTITYYNFNIIYPIKTSFSCPECHKGFLCINDKNTIKEEEYKAYNKMIRDKYEGEFDVEWFMYSFVGHLECNVCNEKIALLGKSTYSEYFNEEDGSYSEVTYSIKYFERVDDFIAIDSLKNEELKRVLRQSFLLYFNDKESCANKIRVFLDMFLTDLGVPETKEKGNFIPLEQRIRNCNKLNKIQKDTLIILKDVGNEGSHGDGEISNADLYKTYKILEEIIIQEKNKPHIVNLKSKYSKKK